MDRRRFLTLLGLGTAGTAGTGLARRGPGTDGEAPRSRADPLVPTSTGEQRIIWSVDTDAPLVALTFDDGPDPAFTPRILEVLDRHRVSATFFSLGFNAMQHPGLMREVVDAGHEVGSHGWKHLNLAEASPQETRREIEFGTQMVEENAEVQVRVFRPPYGRFNEVAVRLLAQRPVDMFVWSVTRGGLAWTKPEQIASHIKSNTSAGDIVDLHDGIGRGTFQRDRAFARQLTQRRSVEIDALPQILEEAERSGLRFTTVSELVAKARPPENTA